MLNAGGTLFLQQYSKGLRKFQKVHLFLKGAQPRKVFDYAESEFDVNFYV